MPKKTTKKKQASRKRKTTTKKVSKMNQDHFSITFLMVSIVVVFVALLGWLIMYTA